MDGTGALEGFVTLEQHEKLTIQAKIADQAGRRLDAKLFMQERAGLGIPLNAEERDLLSAAYKGLIGELRLALDVVEEEVRVHRQQGSEHQAEMAKSFGVRLGAELTELCRELIDVAETLLVKAEVGEPKVFYKKLKADYHRYMVDCSLGSDDSQDGRLEDCMTAYIAALKEAEFHLLTTHPVRLGLALNYSVFQAEALADLPRAVETAKMARVGAVQALDGMDIRAWEDSHPLLERLQDNIQRWTIALEMEELRKLDDTWRPCKDLSEVPMADAAEEGSIPPPPLPAADASCDAQPPEELSEAPPAPSQPTEPTEHPSGQEQEKGVAQSSEPVEQATGGRQQQQQRQPTETEEALEQGDQLDAQKEQPAAQDEPRSEPQESQEVDAPPQELIEEKKESNDSVGQVEGGTEQEPELPQQSPERLEAQDSLQDLVEQEAQEKQVQQEQDEDVPQDEVEVEEKQQSGVPEGSAAEVLAQDVTDDQHDLKDQDTEPAEHVQERETQEETGGHESALAEQAPEMPEQEPGQPEQAVGEKLDHPDESGALPEQRQDPGHDPQPQALDQQEQKKEEAKEQEQPVVQEDKGKDKAPELPTDEEDYDDDGFVEEDLSEEEEEEEDDD